MLACAVTDERDVSGQDRYGWSMSRQHLAPSSERARRRRLNALRFIAGLVVAFVVTRFFLMTTGIPPERLSALLEQQSDAFVIEVAREREREQLIADQPYLQAVARTLRSDLTEQRRK